MTEKDIKAEFEAMDLDGNKKVDLREIKEFCKELCRRKISEVELEIEAEERKRRKCIEDLKI